MNTKEILEAAKARIDKPQKWMRGYSTEGRTCAVGAVDIVTDFEHKRAGAALALLEAQLSELWQGELGTWNDRHSHAEVMDLFDKAIRVA